MRAVAGAVPGRLRRATHDPDPVAQGEEIDVAGEVRSRANEEQVEQ
jgi:hypothetical protein